MNIRAASLLADLSITAALAVSGPAAALSMKECRTKYAGAKAAGRHGLE